MIYLDAYNIKGGGGVKVLSRIIDKLHCSKISFVIVSNNQSLNTLGPLHHTGSIIVRDLFLVLKRNVIYLSNIPPIIKFYRNLSIFYLHQRYWVDPVGRKYMSTTKSKVNYFGKRLFWKIFKVNICHIVVQTQDMYNLILDLRISNKYILPVFQEADESKVQSKTGFLIVGDNTPHKSGKIISLLIAFLKSQSIDYTFAGYIGKTNSDGSQSRWLDQKEYFKYLRSSQYVFISSTFESLGLPFIEAAQADCTVITPEKFTLLDEVLGETYTLEEFCKSYTHDKKFLPSKLLIRDRSNELISLMTKIFSLE